VIVAVTREMAFSVALWGLSWWTQAHCSRMLTNSNNVDWGARWGIGLSPLSPFAVRNSPWFSLQRTRW